MISTQLPNPTGPNTTITAPPHPSGGLWAWEMVMGSERVYADTIESLIDVLYPGYSSMGENDKWTARYLIAVLAQVHVQADLNMRADLTRLPRDQQIVLTGPRHMTVMVPTWDCVIPLVLIRTDYAPASMVPEPFPVAGMPANVWWIDPSDDLSLLTTLHNVGYIALYTSRN